MSGLAGFFSKNKSSSHGESSARSGTMNRGREIVRGKLWLRKAKSVKGQLAEVVVYCAVPDGSQAGQIEIFEEVSKNYQKPKRVISLAEVIPPGVQQGSPCVSLSCSPGAHSPRNSSYLATSPSLNGQTLYPFQMVLRNGEVIEFFAETAEDQRQWMKRLGLLLMFPYSPIPEEPPVDPIKESMKAKLNSKDYNADSVWGVYILPEEVGSRLTLLGFHVVALRSTLKNVHPGQLDIINPMEPSSPIVTWDRDKMRRTGCLGNMVFIEIGRRCRGGAGLIWMYAGQREAGALRETLHTFLFKGDGHAIPITTSGNVQEPNIASFDSSVHSSYRRGSSGSSITRSPSINTPRRQYSVESFGSDSGNHSSPAPPIDLQSHPSRRRSNSSSRRISYENTDDSGFSRGSYTSSEMPESLDSAVGMEPNMFELEADSLSPEDLSEVRPVDRQHSITRHNSIPSSSNGNISSLPHRSHSTSTCHPSARAEEYIRMINPKLQLEKDDYVVMHPASDDTLRQMRSDSDSPRRTGLHPIVENKDTEDYQNVAMMLNNGSEKFVNYSRSYENIEHVRQELEQNNLYDVPRSSKHEIYDVPRSTGYSTHNIPTRNSSTDLYDVPRGSQKRDSPPRTDKEQVVIGNGGRIKCVSPPSHSSNVRTCYGYTRSSSPSPVIIDTP